MFFFCFFLKAEFLFQFDFCISRKAICSIWPILLWSVNTPPMRSFPLWLPPPSRTVQVRDLQSRGPWRRPTPWPRSNGRLLSKGCKTTWARGRAPRPRNLWVGILKKKKKSSKKKLNSFSLLRHCPWGAVLCDALYNLNIFQLLQCLFVSKVELEVEENLFCWILRWWINMQIIDGDWPWPQLMQHFSGFCCERSVLLVQADCNFDLTVALQDLH